MKRIILICCALSMVLEAGSPISGYDRTIKADSTIQYVQKDGKFLFIAKQIIDSDNIRNKGTVDNYDDPYIDTILSKLTPFASARAGKEKISIVFKNQTNKKNFLEEFGLKIFEEQNLSIELYMMDMSKVKLPLNLQVYPLFVMNDRYVQGVIGKKLLGQLMQESRYTTHPQIDISTLSNRLQQKYDLNITMADISYNNKIELFEIKQKGKGKLESYISKDGRYIIVPK